MRSNKFKKMKKILGSSLALVAFSATAFTSAVLNVTEANADSILDAPSLTIPKKGDTVSSKYTFIAQFNEGKTEVTPFGKAKTRLLTDETGGLKQQGYSSNVVVFNPNEQDNIEDIVGSGVEATHVGIYEGKELDLRITITKFSPPAAGNHYGNIMLALDNISLNTQDYRNVDFDYEYFEHGTDIPVAVSGFMTINDLDWNQGFTMSKETSESVKNIYVSSDTNKISFKNDNGKYVFYDTTGINVAPDNLDHTFTFTYENASKLSLSWGNLTRNGVETANLRPNAISGDYFGYIAKKPLKTEFPAPIKGNTDSDEDFVEKNELIDRYEAMFYTIKQFVPDEYEDFYSEELVIGDQIKDIFDIEKITIENEEETNADSFFTVNIDKNEMTATATAEALKNAEFYGHTYIFKVHVKIKDDADLSEYSENNIVTIDNIAYRIADGDEKDTNKTETIIKFTPEIPAPNKEVLNEAGENIDTEKVVAGDTLFYEKNQPVNILNDDIASLYTRFMISDELPEQVEYVNATVLVNGKEIAVEVISYDEETHTITFDGNERFLSEMVMNGETYTLRTETKVIDSVTDGELIANTGKTTINDLEQETNEVTNIVEIPVVPTPSTTEPIVESSEPSVSSEPTVETPVKTTPKTTKPTGSLPQTGEDVKKLMTVVGLCLIAGVIGGMVLLSKKKAQEDEEQEENEQEETEKETTDE